MIGFEFLFPNFICQLIVLHRKSQKGFIQILKKRIFFNHSLELHKCRICKNVKRIKGQVPDSLVIRKLFK